jgi:hypothetical protein
VWERDLRQLRISQVGLAAGNLSTAGLRRDQSTLLGKTAGQVEGHRLLDLRRARELGARCSSTGTRFPPAAPIVPSIVAPWRRAFRLISGWRAWLRYGVTPAVSGRNCWASPAPKCTDSAGGCDAYPARMADGLDGITHDEVSGFSTWSQNFTVRPIDKILYRPLRWRPAVLRQVYMVASYR